MLVLVPLQAIDDTWPLVSPLLKLAINKNGTRTTLNDLFTMVRTGGALLFVFQDDSGIHGALVATVSQGYTGQVGFILAWGANETMDWEAEFSTLWDHFKSIGVEKVLCEGRKGLKSIFPKSRIIRHVFEMRL